MIVGEAVAGIVFHGCYLLWNSGQENRIVSASFGPSALAIRVRVSGLNAGPNMPLARATTFSLLFAANF